MAAAANTEKTPTKTAVTPSSSKLSAASSNKPSPTKSIDVDSFLPPQSHEDSIDSFLEGAGDEEAAVSSHPAAVVAGCDSSDDEASGNPMVMTVKQDFQEDDLALGQANQDKVRRYSSSSNSSGADDQVKTSNAKKGAKGNLAADPVVDQVSLKMDDLVVSDNGADELPPVKAETGTQLFADTSGREASDSRSNEGEKTSDSHERGSSKKSKKHKKEKKSKKHKKRRDSSSEGEPKVRNELEDFLNGGSNHDMAADAGNYEEL